VYVYTAILTSLMSVSTDRSKEYAQSESARSERRIILYQHTNEIENGKRHVPRRNYYELTLRSRADSRSASQYILRLLLKTTDSLPYSQQPAISYTGKKNPAYIPHFISLGYILILSPSTCMSSLQYFSSLSCALHALPTQSTLICSP
jgi:hypothetical protein